MQNLCKIIAHYENANASDIWETLFRLQTNTISLKTVKQSEKQKQSDSSISIVN